MKHPQNLNVNSSLTIHIKEHHPHPPPPQKKKEEEEEEEENKKIKVFWPEKEQGHHKPDLKLYQ